MHHVIFAHKKVHRGGRAHFAGKHGFDSPRLYLTLIRHAIFVKKKQDIEEGELVTLVKKDYTHIFEKKKNK